MVDRSKILVITLIALAAGAAGYAVWVRYTQSNQSIALWGAAHADRIRNAPYVEVWRLSAEGDAKPESAPDGQVVNVLSRRELRDIRDLSYIRAAFLNDRFSVPADDPKCRPAWRYVLRFEADGESSTLWIDDTCNVVQLGETDAKRNIIPGVLRSVCKFLDRYAPQ